jgi:nitric oxide reductase NorD protein
MAVLTLVDLSGSTQGSVLAEEQRAVILFAEALRTLNVPHAFFGFSSEGAQACHFLRIRDWADDDVNVAKRMGSLVAGGGSRLGVYIRHATAKLAARPEDDRLLIVLSDGRPEDRDGYRGTYGVADTAVAVREAVKCGVHIHCVSMEGDDAAYLKTIFGPDGYTVVSSAGLLASRLPMVFRSLTRR